MQALSGILPRSEAARATAIFPANGMAREQLAFAEFQTAFAANQDISLAANSAQSIALNSIATDPLAPKSYAIAAMAQSDPVARRAILADARTLNRRDLALQGLVLQERLAENDYRGVIETLDQILRVHPDYSAEFFSVLLETLKSPEAIDLFPDILTGASPWHQTFLRYSVRDPQARSSLAKIRGRIAIADEQFDRTLISGLAEQGELDAALALYAQIPRSSSNAAWQSWRADYPPFDWELAGESDFRSQPSRDGQELELFVRPGQGGVIARRVLPIAVTPFQVSIGLNSAGSSGSDSIRVQLRCDLNGAVFFEEGLSPGENTFTISDTPTACSSLTIEIEARALRGEPTLRAELAHVKIGPN